MTHDVETVDWSSTNDLLNLHLRKIAADGLPDYIKNSFSLYFRKLCANETGVLRETDIRPVEPTALKGFDDLAIFADRGRAELQRCSIAKLNGGLGTSMGLQKAKSLLVVQQGLSFLDIIRKQVSYFRETSQITLPLLFMNSFNTEQDTLDALAGFEGNPGGMPLSFLQHRFPKVLAASGKPADWPANQQLTWNPPGHGEFYSALEYSGTLQALLDNGIEYLFISNSDNLGATLSLEILGYMAANEIPFIMEVAERTPNDKKGGHLAFTADGRLTLRESAQCDEADVEAFQDIARHRFFNTNTLWVSLSALQQQLTTATDGVLDLPMIRNEKRLDPTDAQSPKVYQLESAMGAAISLFDGAQAVVVPRSRFLPVKKTNDLLLIRSDCYALNEDFSVTDQRPADAGPCVVNLESDYYGTIAKFDQRFPEGVPSLINCHSLAIEGDVRFGRNVQCVGDVHIRNASGAPVTIDDNTNINGSVSY
ncbi:MAG: UTP--glucose-1-phosphate uridylyltransferase [Gammaproteobacteria bacterium]|nr:UTP--glucose-1-phosphate uridylyltransferase [Gammaproteobacteria bacterium]